MRPTEANLALLQEHRPLGQLERDVDRLLDDDDGHAVGVRAARTTSRSWPTIVGASPSDSSSISSSRGSVMRAMPSGEHLLLAAGQVTGGLAAALGRAPGRVDAPPRERVVHVGTRLADQPRGDAQVLVHA